MASLDIDDVKDLPTYKLILRAVLRSQIQHLVDQLAAETSDESVILTANVTDERLSELGSSYGQRFLSTKEDVKQQFLGFCLQEHQSCFIKAELQPKEMSPSENQPDESLIPKKTKTPKKRKKCSRFAPKRQKKISQSVSNTSLTEETSGTSLMEETSGTSLIEDTSGTSLIKDTSGTSLIEDTSGTSLVKETYGTGLIEETSSSVTRSKKNSKIVAENQSINKDKNIDTETSNFNENRNIEDEGVLTGKNNNEVDFSLSDIQYDENSTKQKSKNMPSTKQKPKTRRKTTKQKGKRRYNTKQKPKDIVDDQKESSDAEMEKNISKDNNESNSQTEKEGCNSSELLEACVENRLNVAEVYIDHDDNDKDSDTTVEWSEDHDLEDEIADRLPRKFHEKFDGDTKGPQGNSRQTYRSSRQNQENLPSKHVIVTKHVTYESAEDDDEKNENVNSKKSQKLSQSNVNVSSAVDSNEDEDDDLYSKEDSLKDYLSDEDSKMDSIKDNTAEGVQEQSVKDKNSHERVKAETKTKAKGVDVMQVCHQTMHQMMQCVTRAISEERKEKLSSLEMHADGLSPVHSKERSKSSESDYEKRDNAHTGVQKRNDSETCKETENKADATDDDTTDNDTTDKSFKVLAIWNEIANDANEASSEVLYDLIADKLKQNRQIKKSVERDSQTESNAENVPNEESNSVQTEMSVEHRENLAKNKLKSRETSNERERILHDTSMQREQELRNSRQGSLKNDSNSSDLSRQNSEMRSAVNKDPNRSQDTSLRSVQDVVGKTITTNSSELKTQNADKTSKAQNFINIDANVNVPNKSMSTPNKQGMGKPKSANTPKQTKNQTQVVRKPNVQPIPPAKKGKNLVENLILTGVPIIIPDDDDDEEMFQETDEFMPSPRSTAFELKSKQYREQQAMRAAKRMSQVDQRQGYGTYVQQTAGQKSTSSLSTQQSYSQYSAYYQQQQQQQQQYQEYQGRQQFVNQQQQQFNYQEYDDQQQYETQQMSAQQMHSQSTSQLRQQLFTPPKNVAGVASARSRPSMSHQSPGREMSPQSHPFSPPHTPTTPQGTPYFKQGYITPTKHQQNVQIPQSRGTPKQSPAQKAGFQQNRGSPMAKQNFPSGRPIVIEDEPAPVRKQLSTSAVTPQNRPQVTQKQQAYIIKSPISNPQQQNPTPRQMAQPMITPEMDMIRMQQQTLQQEILARRVENRKQEIMPIITNVASMSDRDSMTNLYLQQTHFASNVPHNTDDVDGTFIRQTNERTPIKRVRSDETITSPVEVGTEPANKRRHTSAEVSSIAPPNSVTTASNIALINSQGKSYPDGQISPSKQPPKLEIDIDDVRGILPETGDHPSSLIGPPVLAREVPIDREERPVIPMSPQLVRSDLKSFSPPVSPSTRRLHATPGTRSRASSGASASSSQNAADDASVTSQETPTQPMKKFGCGDCGKSYTTKAALNQHFRKHTQERPFECDVCGKHYSQKSYLKKHILTHFEEKK